MVRINPGAKNKENDTRTASAGSERLSIPSPRMVEKEMFQCPICSRTFKSREDYDSNVLAQHQTETEVKT